MSVIRNEASLFLILVETYGEGKADRYMGIAGSFLALACLVFV